MIWLAWREWKGLTGWLVVGSIQIHYTDAVWLQGTKWNYGNDAFKEMPANRKNSKTRATTTRSWHIIAVNAHHTTSYCTTVQLYTAQRTMYTVVCFFADMTRTNNCTINDLTRPLTSIVTTRQRCCSNAQTNDSDVGDEQSCRCHEDDLQCITRLTISRETSAAIDSHESKCRCWYRSLIPKINNKHYLTNESTAHAIQTS